MMCTGLETLSGEALEKVLALFRYGQIGRYVNGVTHDVNNLLGAVLAYAELIGLNDTLSPESCRMASEIIAAVQQSTALVNGLTEIARKPQPKTAPTNIIQLARRAINLRAYDLRKAKVTVETDFPEQPLDHVADGPRLQEALLYVLSNAMEAVSASDSRVVRIRIRQVDGATDIVIWNSGPPVPESDRERIFDAFYTTKGEEHLGLGLTVARQTARRHDGDLVYVPEDGFVLHLPAKDYRIEGATGP